MINLRSLGIKYSSILLLSITVTTNAIMSKTQWRGKRYVMTINALVRIHANGGALGETHEDLCSVENLKFVFANPAFIRQTIPRTVINQIKRKYLEICILVRIQWRRELNYSFSFEFTKKGSIIIIFFLLVMTKKQCLITCLFL